MPPRLLLGGLGEVGHECERLAGDLGGPDAADGGDDAAPVGVAVEVDVWTGGA